MGSREQTQAAIQGLEEVQEYFELSQTERRITCSSLRSLLPATKAKFVLRSNVICIF